MSLKDLQVKRQLTVDEGNSIHGVPTTEATPLVAPIPKQVEVERKLVVIKDTNNHKNDINDSDDDIQIPKTPQRPKTSGTINNQTQNISTADAAYETMTPKQRLLLNKLKKADEEAARVR
jgi:hypothetical protein